MGLFGRKKKRLNAGLYGKHPDADDFLRLNAAGQELRALDEWLAGALSAAERAIPDWEPCYAAAPDVSLLFNGGGKSEAGIVATLTPSRDRIGRRFPLVLFAEVDLPLLAPRYPSVPFLGFLEQATAVQQRRGSLGRAQLLKAAEELAPPDAGAFDVATRLQQEYLNRTTEREAFADAGGNDGWVEGAIRGLHQVAMDVGQGRPLPRYGVRIPLSGQRPAAQASFWLALLQEVCSIPVVPTAMWSDQRMLIYLAPPSDKALMGLWRAEWQHDTLFDLAQPSDANAAPPVTDRPLRSLLSARS